MTNSELHSNRRTFLGGVSALAGALALGPRVWAQEGDRFSRQLVIEAAQALAAKPYSSPPKVPDQLLNLNYDTYRKIRYRKKAAIWGGTPTKFAIELFAPGNLFASGIDVSVVENGKAFPVPVHADTFETPTKEIGEFLAKLGQVAGFRLHFPINRDDYKDEFVVFQGASYFRAVSRDQTYGLSARGLAIDVAEPTGEEFPIFRKFWIERPSSAADSIVVHALLDSPRVAGAYRFGIYPDTPTRLDIEATLFARAPLRHVGLGALTSMFLFGSIDRADQPDYRTAVYDSTGLAMHTGSGERLWRPLSNPQTLQISAFMDKNPKGFGLILRDRTPEAFQDLEAGYHTRPSAWVMPMGEWGDGHVQLVEIPTSSEANDNIVAYWRPKSPILPGTPYNFAYRLTWPNDNWLPPAFGRVARSAYGLTLGANKRPQMVIDYVGLPENVPVKAIKIDAGASQGKIVESVVQQTGPGRIRIFMTFDPAGATLSELRLQPKLQANHPAKQEANQQAKQLAKQLGGAIGETWLYRWSAR